MTAGAVEVGTIQEEQSKPELFTNSKENFCLWSCFEVEIKENFVWKKLLGILEKLV